MLLLGFTVVLMAYCPRFSKAPPLPRAWLVVKGGRGSAGPAGRCLIIHLAGGKLFTLPAGRLNPATADFALKKKERGGAPLGGTPQKKRDAALNFHLSTGETPRERTPETNTQNNTMGKHLIIIGVTGSLDPQRMPLIIDALCRCGLQIRHASARYDGTGITEMAVGTTEDLTTELASLGHKLEVVTSGTGAPAPAVPENVTLATVNTNVLQVLALLSADKQPGEKKEAAPKPPRQASGGKKTAPPPGQLNEPPKDAHLDKDGKPAVPGDKPEGALPLPTSTSAAGGDEVQPPKDPPPDVVEDTTGDEGNTTTEEPKKEEGAEG
jgi:hypothetical protein